LELEGGTAGEGVNLEGIIRRDLRSFLGIKIFGRRKPDSGQRNSSIGENKFQMAAGFANYPGRNNFQTGGGKNRLGIA
jgi:hypothetical protein